MARRVNQSNVADLAELKSVLAYDSITGMINPGDIAGYPDKDGYTVIGYKGMAYPAHRLVWYFECGAWPKHQIDHRDLVRTNKFELRPRINSMSIFSTYL